MKIEVADDFRVEKRDRVGGDGIAEAGVEFLGERRAADNRPALKHGDFEPRGGEIGGRDKAIVTPANDDDVAHAISLQAAPEGRRRIVDPDSLTTRAYWEKPVSTFPQSPLRVKTQSACLRRRPLWGERTATNSLPCSRDEHGFELIFA